MVGLLKKRNVSILIFFCMLVITFIIEYFELDNKMRVSSSDRLFNRTQSIHRYKDDNLYNNNKKIK